PDWKDWRYPCGAQELLTISPNIFEEEIAKRKAAYPLGLRFFDNLVHRRFVLSVAAQIRNWNFPQRQFGGIRLSFQKLGSNRVHRYALVNFIHSGHQPGDLEFLPLP